MICYFILCHTIVCAWGSTSHYLSYSILGYVLYGYGLGSVSLGCCWCRVRLTVWGIVERKERSKEGRKEKEWREKKGEERKEGKKEDLRDSTGYHAILLCTGMGATTVLLFQSMETEVYSPPSPLLPFLSLSLSLSLPFPSLFSYRATLCLGMVFCVACRLYGIAAAALLCFSSYGFSVFSVCSVFCVFCMFCA